MQTRTAPSVPFDEEHPLRVMTTSIAPVARRRVVLSAVLSVVAIVFGIVLFLAFGYPVLAFYLPSLPMALVLLWSSADVLRADEVEPIPPEVVRAYGR
jgi:hypothetical protein